MPNQVAGSQTELASKVSALESSIGTVPSGQTVEGQITSLNSNLAGLKVASGNVQSGASVTINSVRIALVLVGRAAASVHVTTALIDQWGGIVYIDNNTDFVVSKSNSNVTITNNASSVTNYLVLYTS